MPSTAKIREAGRTLGPYAAAAGFAAAAVVARLAIDHFLTIDLPFLVFVPAILAAALWFGVGPAILCTFLSGAAVVWLWMIPEGSPAGLGASRVQELLLFALSGALIAWLVESSRRNRARAREADVAAREAAARKQWQGEAEQQMAELVRTVTARTEELREREALMQAVVETAVDAILTIDERGSVQSFNQAAERMFGYPAAEVVGRNVNLLMPSPYREEHDAYVNRYLETGEKRIIGIGREITARRKDGSSFPMYLSVSEVRLAGRRLFTGFVRDLTEPKRLEQEFLRSQKMEAIGSLSGGIAHDFNNILMGILSCARVAAGTLQKESPLRESFDEIAAAANRGVALTRRLLAFSRRAATVELRPTSLDEVVRENETMLRHLLGEDVEFRIELASSGASLLADAGLIEQIVINLLVNARDAMPGGGEITVSTRADVQEVVLEVADTGSGIPAEIAARIFEPFFTTKHPDKGTGLGLSTVKRITEQLRGRIDLESEVGRGTTFRVVFPRCASESRPAPARARAAAAEAQGHTVLLVEDDRLVRASLARFLQGKGYAVVAAGSPSEALAAARTNDAIDVLVTDMVLPESTGNELAVRLCAHAPSLKVIFMSAHPAEILTARGQLEAGAPYLEKPFEMEALVQLLGQVLAGGDGARSASARAPEERSAGSSTRT